MIVFPSEALTQTSRNQTGVAARSRCLSSTGPARPRASLSPTAGRPAPVFRVPGISGLRGLTCCSACFETGRMTEQVLGSWWYRGRDFTNFGDELNRHLRRLLGFRSEYTSLERCELVGAGSVLETVRRRRREPVAVWGSGFLHGGGSEGSDSHRYLAVRGKLTAARLPHADIRAIGDPGLLARDLVQQVEQVPGTIARVPHYSDRAAPFVRVMARFDHVRIINVYDEPLQVVGEIAGCSFVLSSSLHGLVVADSLGIPNAWIKLSNRVLGGDFKLRDYYSCFDMTPQPIDEAELFSNETELIKRLAEGYRRPGLKQLQQDLRAAFKVR